MRIKENLGAEFKKLIAGPKNNQKLEIGIIQNGKHSSGINLFELATYLEYGTDRAPGWHYNESAFEKVKEQIGHGSIPAELSNLFIKGENLTPKAREQAFSLVKDYKKNIEDIKTPHNAPSTIRQKGFDDPLIETGEFSTTPRGRLNGGGTFG